MFKFIASLLILSLFLAGLVFLAVGKSWIVTPSFFYQTLIFLFFSTAMIFAYLCKATKPDFFVQLYLTTMGIKLLAYSVYVYFMITSDPAGTVMNVAFFLLSYFLFTALEIGFLYHKISAQAPS